MWPHHYNQLNLGDLQRLPESSLSSFPFVSRRGAAPWIAGGGMEGQEPAPGRGSSSVWPCGQVAVVLLHLRACHLPPECTPRPQRWKYPSAGEQADSVWAPSGMR